MLVTSSWAMVSYKHARDISRHLILRCSGGMQDIFYGIREKTRNIADHHANLARTVDMSIVQHLHKLRTEIKAHIKNIQMDTGKLAVVSLPVHQLVWDQR